MKIPYLRPLLFGVVMAAAQCTQAEVGAGVSLRADGQRLYMPVSLSDSYRLEPSIYYHNRSYDPGQQYLELAVGLFRVNPLTEKVSTYYGARAGYLHQSDPFYSDNSEEMTISPTLGVEYFLSSRFSIAGEAAVVYQRISSRTSGYGEMKTITTDLLLRYMF